MDVLAQLLVHSIVANRQSGAYIINAQLPQGIAWGRLVRYLNVDNHHIIYNTEKWHRYIMRLDCRSDLFALKLLYEIPRHLNLLEEYNKIRIYNTNFKYSLHKNKIALPKVYNTDLIIRLFGSVANSKEKDKITMVKRINNLFSMLAYRMQLLYRDKKISVFLGIVSLASVLFITQFSDMLTVTIE